MVWFSRMRCVALAATVLAVVAGGVAAQDTPNATLITGARIFDGSSPDLIEGMDVLVEGNTISAIAADIEAPDGATVIDATGRTLMPGMIDNHWHSLFATIPQAQLLTSDIAYINIHAAKADEEITDLASE